jgi:hypothetical protein
MQAVRADHSHGAGQEREKHKDGVGVQGEDVMPTDSKEAGN